MNGSIKKVGIHIAPIKRFVTDMHAEPDVSDVAAVLSTSYSIRENIPLNEFCYVQYDDVISADDPSGFTYEMADKIKNFVFELSDNITDIFFCCDRGESRSAALACAFMRYFGQDEMKIWVDTEYHPNLLVYKVMCRSLGMSCSPIRMMRLRSVSKNALRKKIRAAKS